MFVKLEMTSGMAMLGPEQFTSFAI